MIRKKILLCIAIMCSLFLVGYCSAETLPQEITWGKDNSEMVLVPAGEFLMGSPEGEGWDDEHPQHKVYLDAYYIDKYEVRDEQYIKFSNEWGKDTDEDGNKMIYIAWQPYLSYGKYPVADVSWYGAKQYAKWAGKRLPTEAEWEKACRAGSTTKYCFGNDESGLGEYAWYAWYAWYESFFSAALRITEQPVGEKEPNNWGIYDMHGNVWECCADWYDEDYYKISPYKNPQGPDTGCVHVFRGGSSSSKAEDCRSAARFRNIWKSGFRCVISASDVKKMQLKRE